MKKVIFIVSSILISLTQAMASPKGAKTTKQNTSEYDTVPAQLLTDANKLKMVHGVKDLHDGRFFYLDYTEDYKLDGFSSMNLKTSRELIEAITDSLCDKKLPLAGGKVTFGAGCSAFSAVTPEHNDYIMGRNFDFSHNNEKIAAAMVHSKPVGGLESISMVDAYWIGYRQGLWHCFTDNTQAFEANKKRDLSYLMGFPYLLMDGMNSAGFAIAVLHLDGEPTQQTSTGKRLMTTLLMRNLLDHAVSVNKAIEMLEDYDFWVPEGEGNYHFYMADSTGNSAVVEYAYKPGQTAGTPNTRCVMLGKKCVSNFYLSDAMIESDHGPLSAHGKTRYEMMNFVLKQNNGKLSEESAMWLLNGVSQAENPAEPTSHTQWSVVYNLSQKTATVCVNRDYKKQFLFNINGYLESK